VTRSGKRPQTGGSNAGHRPVRSLQNNAAASEGPEVSSVLFCDKNSHKAQSTWRRTPRGERKGFSNLAARVD
jgi:hypothetical protein